MPFPTPGDLPDPGIEPVSPISPKLQVDPLPLSHRGSPLLNMVLHYFSELISRSLQTYWPSCCFFLIIIYLFISGCTGSSLLHRLFSVVGMGYFLGVVHGFLIVVFLLLQAQALGHVGFSSCNTGAQYLWLMGFRAQAQYHTGLVTLRHVGSSWIRDQTHVSCTGKWILYQ